VVEGGGASLGAICSFLLEENIDPRSVDLTLLLYDDETTFGAGKA
jgi:hypothetical protein